MKIKPNPPHKNCCSQNERWFIARLPTVLCLMLVALLNYSVSAVAGTATFKLVDQTNLPGGTYAIYVAGYSATPGYYLNSDGRWLQLTAQSGQIPCYQLGTGAGQISQMVIDSGLANPPLAAALSARIYYFVVTDKTTFPTCNTDPAKNGIFNTTKASTVVNGITVIPSPLNYVTLGSGNYSIYQPSSADLIAGTVPLFNFGEMGPGPTAGTIDLSQVDFFSFPMNIQASVTPVGSGIIANPPAIGNPLSLSYSAINDAYTSFMNNLAGAGGCTAHPAASACAYLSLSAAYTTANDPTKRYYWANPGSYLAQINPATNKLQNATSGLNTVFDPIITTLWASGAPAITLNNGGIQGGNAPQENFTGTTVTMNYPCNTAVNNAGCPSVQAIKFVGQTSGYVAYIFSPIGYNAGCTAGTITSCPQATSSGYQVFAGAGVFATTSNSEYTNLVAAGVLQPSSVTVNDGIGTYNAQVARLGLIITQALNHGVASMTCGSSPTWQCWNLETNWYPVQTSSAVPDITQNLFAQFMHTAQASLIPVFLQPPSAVKSAGGSLMGMAYGFSNDEQPTPPVSGSTSPEVPSKMDQTVQYGGTGPYTITFGPWVSTQECVFNWAESNYSNLFPSSAGAQTLSGLYQTQNFNYRHYTSTQSYLGVSVANNDVYYMGANGSMIDEGNLYTKWAPTAGCPVMAHQESQARCVLNWAESNYPNLFSPAATQTLSGPYNGQNYIYRQYTNSNSTLGVSTTDNHVYYMGAGGGLIDEGDLTAKWAPLAGCPL